MVKIKNDKHRLKAFFINSNLWVIQIPIMLLSISVVPVMRGLWKIYGDACLSQCHSTLRSLGANSWQVDCHFPLLNQLQGWVIAYTFFANKPRFNLRIFSNIEFQVIIVNQLKLELVQDKTHLSYLSQTSVFQTASYNQLMSILI